MGLDMSLFKYPKINGVTIKEMDLAVRCIRWRDDFEFGDLLKPDVALKLLPYIHIGYDAWDDGEMYPYITIPDEYAYWRKANAIHKWFVDNICGGVDDCELSRAITQEEIVDLHERCKTILGTTNKETWAKLLPTLPGFFFGSTEYDDRYLEDIRHTLIVCESILKDFDFDKYSLHYEASW